jgi:hypothetical protein
LEQQRLFIWQWQLRFSQTSQNTSFAQVSHFWHVSQVNGDLVRHIRHLVHAQHEVQARQHGQGSVIRARQSKQKWILGAGRMMRAWDESLA